MMHAYAPPHNSPNNGEDNFGRRIEEAVTGVAEEILHGVAYVDAVIVPQVRREAGILARVLAGHLDRLADTLHPSANVHSGPASGAGRKPVP